MSERHRRHRFGGGASSIEQKLTLWLLGALLAFAPWIRGSNRQVAVALLLGLALALVAVLVSRYTLSRLAMLDPKGMAGGLPHAFWSVDFEAPRWKWLLVLLLATSPQWIGLLQLIPMPLEWWRQLPGRQAYLAAQQAAGIATPSALPLSLNPLATQASIWASIPVTVVFITALLIPAAAVYPIIKLLLGLGMAQVVLAVAQFATGGPESPLYFGGLNGGAVVGSFTNRNSLADFLAMMVPLWFVVLLHLDRHGYSKRHGDGGPFQGLFKPLWALCGFALLVALITTQSRGGLLASMVVMALSLWVYLSTRNRQELSLKARAGIALGLAAFSVAALMAAGADKITTRIQHQQLITDAELRTRYALTTFEAAQHLWPLGSGLGSFESVFPRYQPLHAPGYVNQAHNDYPQLLMELGFWSVLLASVLLVLIIHQLVKLREVLKVDGRLSTSIAMQWLAGSAALALMLHSWVDFNMRVPALAMTAAFLAGIFLRPPKSGRTTR